MLKDATSHFGPTADAALVASHAWSAPVPIIEALTAALGPSKTALSVYANHGRWVVECPDCHSAQLAHPDDRRFMCNCCANVAVDGKWRRVVWPKARAAIEALLADRPTENQNWLPGETVAQLRAENREFMMGGA